jgi:hypothetical protein
MQFKSVKSGLADKLGKLSLDYSLFYAVQAEANENAFKMRFSYQ